MYCNYFIFYGYLRQSPAVWWQKMSKTRTSTHTSLPTTVAHSRSYVECCGLSLLPPQQLKYVCVRGVCDRTTERSLVAMSLGRLSRKKTLCSRSSHDMTCTYFDNNCLHLLPEFAVPLSLVNATSVSAFIDTNKSSRTAAVTALISHQNNFHCSSLFLRAQDAFRTYLRPGDKPLNASRTPKMLALRNTNRSLISSPSLLREKSETAMPSLAFHRRSFDQYCLIFLTDNICDVRLFPPICIFS